MIDPIPGQFSSSEAKSVAVYLMELRRRIAEAHSRKQKLEVVTWTQAEQSQVPIRGASKHLPFDRTQD